MGPGLVLLLGAKFQQVKNVLFAQFSSIRRELDPEASIQLANYYQDREKYPNWAVHALTTANPEGIAGYHPERVLVIVDEASVALSPRSTNPLRVFFPAPNPTCC